MANKVCLAGDAPKIPPQSMEVGKIEQLEQFFKTTANVQKLFKVDGVKVGIFFAPNAERIKVKPLGDFSCQVFLMLEKELPNHALEKITSKIPSKYKWYHLVAKNVSFDGKSIFQVLGFE
ncbi:MAG TPA: hypothetical protein VHK67_00160 [Rhabdochlamydiaceae bacterium]|nr:hypothetical protein [Rhabdochlamydiaceae bacterium]